MIVALTWHLGTLVFRDYDPFLAFFHLGAGITELPWAYGVLGVVLAGSLWIERFFCKYACPLGAVLGILGKAGLTKLERDPEDCKGCNICQKKCHAHVDFLSVTTIRDAECNHCMDCVVECPKPNVLAVRGPRWRFSHPVYASLLIGGLFALIGVSQLAGKWQTRPAAVSFTDAAGKPDAENIRGWMTLQEIARGFGLPLERLYSAAGIPQRVSPETRLNRIAKDYNLAFEPERVRDVVRSLVTGASPPPRSPKQRPSGEPPEVRGFMTLHEISLKTGVPKDHLLRSLGVGQEIDGRAPVREWLHGKGKTIQDLRDAVEQYHTRKP